MTLYYNNNPLYGDAGPHEANNKEELVEEMMDNIRTWASEESDPGSAIEEMKTEFRNALEEVTE